MVIFCGGRQGQLEYLDVFSDFVRFSWLKTMTQITEEITGIYFADM